MDESSRVVVGVHLEDGRLAGVLLVVHCAVAEDGRLGLQVGENLEICPTSGVAEVAVVVPS